MCVCGGVNSVGEWSRVDRGSNVIILIHSVSNLDQLSEWNNKLDGACDNTVALDCCNWKSTETSP